VLFHHIGCVVQSIESYLKLCIGPLGFTDTSPVYEVSSQAVRVCFVRLSSGSFLELVEPSGPTSPVDALRKRGGGYYHLCFLVEDIDVAAEHLTRKGYIQKGIFASGSLEWGRCCFLLNPFGHLVELAERLPAAIVREGNL
jgi:methylmalonyl-CoA/ethylmalonyl-CoA epimerase